MNNKAFFDSNIFIYGFTNDDNTKRDIVFELLDSYNPVISAQVIKKFTNVLTKKFNIEYDYAISKAKEIIAISEFVTEDKDLVFAAFDVIERFNYSLFDSFLIAAALNSNCTIFYSEDLQDGQIIDNTLKIINPFNDSLIIKKNTRQRRAKVSLEERFKDWNGDYTEIINTDN